MGGESFQSCAWEQDAIRARVEGRGGIAWHCLMVAGLAVRGRRQCEAKIVDQRGGLIGRWILIG